MACGNEGCTNSECPECEMLRELGPRTPCEEYGHNFVEGSCTDCGEPAVE
jgi:hypothetical protein